MLLEHFNHYQVTRGGEKQQAVQSCRSSTEITPPRSHFTHELQVRAAHLWEARRFSAIPSTVVVEDRRTQISTKYNPGNNPNLTCQPHTWSILLLSTNHSSQSRPVLALFGSLSPQTCARSFPMAKATNQVQEEQPAGASLLVLQSCPSCTTHTSAPWAALLCLSELFPLFFQQIPVKGKSSAFDTEAFQSTVFFSLR